MDALQFISYYPADHISGLTRAHEHDESHAAKHAFARIFIGRRMCEVFQNTSGQLLLIKAALRYLLLVLDYSGPDAF